MGNKKRLITKIAIILIIIMLVDITMPILNSHASFLEAVVGWVGEKVFIRIAEWLVEMGDVVIEALQNIFVSLDRIHINGTRYVIKYSPGIIFSGNVLALDVNFINPKESEESYLYYNTVQEFVQRRMQRGEDILEDIEIGEWNGNYVYLGVNGFSADGLEISGAEQYFKLYGGKFTITGKTLYDIIDDNSLEELVKGFFANGNQSVDSLYVNSEFASELCVVLSENGYAGACSDEGITTELGAVEINGSRYELYYYSLEDYYVELHSKYKNVDEIIVTFEGQSGLVKDSTYRLTDEELELLVKENMAQKLINDDNIDDAKVNEIKQEIIEVLSQKLEIKEQKIYESAAKKLRDTIATWFRVMQTIALVGLLSVLVYVSIRMILSTAAQDKAKYKKMVEGWLTAVCILLLLHFIMSITFTVTQAINDVFNANIIGEKGEDILITGIRNDIENHGSITEWLSVFANEVIYIVLVILTVMFTLQYLKRFIYVAFLTMISPLVALTYPLDKLKDGQAQAFSMWLREFMFSVLIQPVHLVIYFILLGVAKDLVDINSLAYNPIYTIVAISFILPAEKFIRKMFGFDKAEATNVMGSALGGAAVMNAINKLGSKGPKGNSSGSGSNGSDNGSKVRMANEGAGDAYDALRERSSAQKGGASSKASVQRTNTQNGNTAETDSQSANTARTAEQKEDIEDENTIEANKVNTDITDKKEQQNVKTTDEEKTETNAKNTSQNSAPKREIKNAPSRWEGIKGVGKKYVFNKNTGKKLLKGSVKGAAKVAGAAALGTIGLAAGIATGDIEKAISGAAIGLTAGSKLGGNLVEGGENLVKGTVGGAKGIKNTYREGKYGEAEAARMKFDEEFKKSSEYKSLIKNYPGQEETAQEFLNAGITDTKQMGKAMQGMKDGKYNSKEAIAYMKMAEKCPNEILYDEEKFKNYLSSYGIDEANANKIRKGLIDFK